MQVRTLDHINIRSAKIAETVAFYEGVLGMVCKPPPGAGDSSRGTWVCDMDGRAVIHVGPIEARYPGDPETVENRVAGVGGGAIHHVALGCVGYEEMAARLAAAKLEVVTNEALRVGLRQLFVKDPNGVTLELNFREASPA